VSCHISSAYNSKLIKGGILMHLLRIMASMEKWRENYEKLCIDLSEQSYKNEKVTIKEHIKAYL
jgi:hypothetical protein